VIDRPGLTTPRHRRRLKAKRHRRYLQIGRSPRRLQTSPTSPPTMLPLLARRPVETSMVTDGYRSSGSRSRKNTAERSWRPLERCHSRRSNSGSGATVAAVMDAEPGFLERNACDRPRCASTHRSCWTSSSTPITAKHGPNPRLPPGTGLGIGVGGHRQSHAFAGPGFVDLVACPGWRLAGGRGLPGVRWAGG
jgi:hypothetical protein